MILFTLLLGAGLQSVDSAPLGPRTDRLGPLPVAHAHPVRHLVTITGRPLALLRLQRLDLDIVQMNLAEGQVLVIADDDELRAIRTLGLDAAVDIEDLAAYYARRLNVPPPGGSFLGGSYGAGLTPPFGQGGMGGYYTFDEIVSVMDQLQAAYPALVSAKTSIGQSVEGRDIWMIKVSDNPGVDENEPEVRIDALHHAREPQGMQATIYFVSYLLEEYGSDPVATYLVNEREIFVVPCVNPDGYEFNRSQAPGGGGLWRKNRRVQGGSVVGVDLNRNYPFQWGGSGASTDPSSQTYRGASPNSEPETSAMVSFIAARSFATALSVHTYSDYWLSPWGYVAQFPPDWPEMQEIGDLATADNGYEHGPASIVLYLASGTTLDQDYGVHGTYSWTPEIGNGNDGFWPSQSRIVPLAEENRAAFARTALAAGAWLRPLEAVLTELGDGDGVFEPGERVGITARVRNSGRASSGAGTMTVSSTSPFAAVTSSGASFSAASFSTVQNQTPLELMITGQPAPGTVVPFRVEITEGGRTVSLDGSLTVGVRVVASYDFESGGAQGWAVGTPNNATTGEWTRDDPVGTAAQPELDHTPGAGVTCWFTGQGVVGGSLGANDVDGGSTTLVSPAFDLGSAQSATIRYARWYSNDTGASPNADVFQVDLSDDGGATWSVAETVGPTGPETSGGWVEVELDVAQFVALTSDVRIRFIASDLGNGSIVEAAVDDVVVSAVEPSSCPQPLHYCVLSPNSWSSGAVIGATGSTDVAMNDLTLTVTDANPTGFGLFFYGQGRAQMPVGNGSLCIAGGFTRLPVVMTSAAGSASYAIDFPSLATPISNGETWNFQFWLRDIGGAGSNFSDGLEITFCQ